MADFTLTFNATQGATLSISGFTFTKSLLDDKVYICDDPTVRNTLTDDFSTRFSTTLVSVENIPTTITSIRASTFQNCSVLSTVIFASGSNLDNIKSTAFQNCSSLTSIIIPATVTSIEVGAFSICTSLTSITIPATVTSIESAVFISCTQLTSVTFASGSNLTIIADTAFQFCTSLTSITIPATVTMIGNQAFQNCYALTSITIPASVTTFGTDAFAGIPTTISQPPQTPATLYYGSQAVKDHFYITPPPSSDYYGFGDTIKYINDEPLLPFTLTFNATQGATLSISGFTFTKDPLLDTVYICDDPTVRNTLTDDFSLNYRTTLISVENIPANVIIIGSSAFYNCTFLTSVDLASVTTIDNNAFDTCTSLTSVTLTSGLLTIGILAFNSSGLTSVTIPSTVTTIDDGAFINCRSLTSITVDTNNSVYSNYNNDGVLYNKNITTLLQYPIGNIATSFVIPTGVTNIAYAAFVVSNLTSITIPNSVISIGNLSFANNTSLLSISIPASVTSIGNSTFYNCSSLRNITIPNSNVTFGSTDFDGIPTSPPQTLQDAATLYTSPLDELKNPVYAYFKQNFIDGVNQINYTDNGPPPIPMVCFLKDSKILTKQGYRPIQDLRKGDLIKTIKHGYLPIDMIGYREIYNPICEERIKDKLYVCTYKEYSEIFEDLVITGCHSILVENYTTQEQLDKSTEVNGGIFETDGKWRLPACVDERARPYEKEGTHTIYHLALENEDYFMNYGIYANGLVVETCSKRYLKELSNMTIHF